MASALCTDSYRPALSNLRYNIKRNAGGAPQGDEGGIRAEGGLGGRERRGSISDRRGSLAHRMQVVFCDDVRNLLPLRLGYCAFSDPEP